jgi:hypothetical protein
MSIIDKIKRAYWRMKELDMLCAQHAAENARKRPQRVLPRMEVATSN